MAKYYTAIIPFIPSMGTISPTIVQDSPRETLGQQVLREVNSMRRHDGLREWHTMPVKVRYVPIIEEK